MGTVCSTRHHQTMSQGPSRLCLPLQTCWSCSLMPNLAIQEAERSDGWYLVDSKSWLCHVVHRTKFVRD